MKDIKRIAKELFRTCYLVEREIVGHPDEVAERWGKANSIRHGHTIRAILRYARRTNKNTLKILNASGLACGHQDFSICEYLRKRYNIEWTVFESPESPHLSNQKFKELVNMFSVKIELSDLSKVERPYGLEIYDIILFTEIAEHLEHSALIRLLRSIRDRLEDDGLLVLSTPNLASLSNRLKLLLGNGDLDYWGDGYRNLEKGLWGHIVCYDLKRLRRILNDCGLSCVQEYTFSYGSGHKPRYLRKLVNFISHGIPNSKSTIFVTAKKSSIREIPFQI